MATVFLVILLLLFLPMIAVLCSSRVRGGEKFGWALASLFLSWWGFLAFMIVTSLRTSNNNPRMK